MNRRRALRALGGAAAALAGCGKDTASLIPSFDLAGADRVPEVDAGELSCVLAPAQTEGPFFVDEMIERSDLTAGTGEAFVLGGLPLALRLGIYTVVGQACAPLAGARVDLWHASAEGVYSDEPSGLIQSKDTVGERYLRGFQRTDDRGQVQFKTIYPGWYPNRTIHFHLKVRASIAGQPYEFTSQLYIDDAVNDAVMVLPPYNTRGARAVRNQDDGIYAGGGSQLLLDVQPGPGGYSARFALGLRTA